MSVANMLRRVAIAALMVSATALLPGTAQDGTAAPRKITAPACNRAQFRIMVDVGHSKEVPGAVSARGIDEYDFNLRLGRRVERQLVAKGFSRAVLMITDGRAQSSLAKRITRANDAKADLFLSIHHDSVPETFMNMWTYEGKSRRYSDRFPGHSIFVSADNPQYKLSLLFASMIGNEMRARGLHYTPHYIEKFMGERRHELLDAEAGVYRYDRLAVLMFTHMPAVLLEAGMIVHRAEEVALASPERQALIASAVTDAVELYCQLKQVRWPDTAERPPATGEAARVAKKK